MRKKYKIKTWERKSGFSFTAKVWVAADRSYSMSKTFSSWNFDGKGNGFNKGGIAKARDAAEKWADKESAKQKLGIAKKSNQHDEVVTSDVLKLYIDSMRKKRRDEKHIVDTESRLSSLPDMVPRLDDAYYTSKHDGVSVRLNDWWQDWCKQPMVNRFHVHGVIEERDTGEQRSVSTCNLALRNLKAFVRWCWKNRQQTGLKEPIYIDHMERLKQSKHVKPQFTIDELRQGLLFDDPFTIRWALHIYLGARLAELGRLKWEHIQKNKVLLHGKGDKQRYVDMQPELIPFLDAHKVDDDGYLFPEHYRDPKKHRNINRRFCRFLERAGLPKNGRTMHSLRHCYAGIQTATNRPTGALQDLMGHEGTDMTRHYSQLRHIYVEDVKGWPIGEFRILEGYKHPAKAEAQHEFQLDPRWAPTDG